MAVVAANRLLVALRTAREILDERRACKTDRGVRALEEAGEELVEIAAEDLLEVNGLSLQTAILAMENGKQSETQLTDWTELQHWTLPELQVLVAAYVGGSVSFKATREYNEDSRGVQRPTPRWQGQRRAGRTS